MQKHGIVLGPDLNVNGDAGPSEVDGSAGAEPRPTQESQPTPAEGNGVLGKNCCWAQTERMQLLLLLIPDSFHCFHFGDPLSFSKILFV